MTAFGAALSGKVVEDRVLAKVASRTGGLAHSEDGKVQRGWRCSRGKDQRRGLVAGDVHHLVGFMGQHSGDQEVSALVVEAGQRVGGRPRDVIRAGVGSELNVNCSVCARRCAIESNQGVESWRHDRVCPDHA